MMRLAAALALCAMPALAQDRLTQEQCAASLDPVFNVLPTDTPSDAARDLVTLDPDGWCSLRDAKLAVLPDATLYIGDLRWRGSDFDRFIEDTLPPRALEVEGRDISFLITTGVPAIDYLNAIQAVGSGFDFGIDLRWDGLQDALLVNDVYVDIDGTNSIKGSARIDGVDLTDMDAILRSQTTFGLTNLSITSSFDGWFERTIAPQVAMLLLMESDVAPERQVAALQAQAIASIETLLEEFITQNSRDAVVAFIAALPTPRGDAALQLSAQPPLGMDRLAPLFVTSVGDGLPAVLDSIMGQSTIVFTWSPTTPTED